MYAWLTKRRHNAGFTLIELVVVLFILGLLIAGFLMAISLPRYYKARHSAAREEIVERPRWAYDPRRRGTRVDSTGVPSRSGCTTSPRTAIAGTRASITIAIAANG